MDLVSFTRLLTGDYCSNGRMEREALGKVIKPGWPLLQCYKEEISTSSWLVSHTAPEIKTHTAQFCKHCHIRTWTHLKIQFNCFEYNWWWMSVLYSLHTHHVCVMWYVCVLLLFFSELLYANKMLFTSQIYYFPTMSIFPLCFLCPCLPLSFSLCSEIQIHLNDSDKNPDLKNALH